MGLITKANCYLLINPTVAAYMFTGYYCRETMLNKKSFINIATIDIEIKRVY